MAHNCIYHELGIRSHTAGRTSLQDEDDYDKVPKISVIEARLLIPGRGEPIRNGVVVVKDDKIDWVGPYAQLPKDYESIQPVCVPVLMPGLWDCHTHFLGNDIGGSGDLVSLLSGANAAAGALTVDDFRVTLMAGYTSVVEVGGYGGDVWPLVKDGPLIGPNVHSAISILSVTGGHGDLHNYPLKSVTDAAEHMGTPLAVCDGVEGCTKMVRKTIRRGARIIKVCSSGGVLSLNDDPEDRQFSDDELRAIVEEAARSGREVTTHAIGKAGIMAALRTGVKSIQHGMYLDDEVADMMIEKGAIYVPTQHIVRTLLRDNLDTLPAPSRRKLLTIADKTKESFKIAHRKGVKMALGTDIGSSSRSSNMSHGLNAHELMWAVELGMTPLQAIEAATAVSPEILGRLAPKSGQLKAGYDADMIVVNANPLDDIKVLTKAENVTHVWRLGKLYKSPKGSDV